MIIDSHLHLWVNDPKNFPWQPIGGYVPENEAPLSRYLDVMDQNGIDGAVLVQPTPYGWDNSYLLHCKQDYSGKLKAVVLVNPLSENAARAITELVNQGADGLRVNLHLIPPLEWNNEYFHHLMTECASLHCPVCFQLTPEYFTVLKDICKRYPNKYIIDHLGRPEPGTSPDHPKFLELLALSNNKNIYIKLSGLNYYSKEQAHYPDTWELLKITKNAFGADHCMWGSDFPFVDQHWSYTENLKLYSKDLDLSEKELKWIFADTAKTLWWID